MKLKIDKSILVKALNKVKGFTEKKTTMPSLALVLLETAENTLKIKATDMITTIQVTVPCESEEQGTCAVSCANLLDFVKELPKDIVSFKQDAKLLVSQEKNKAKLNILDSKDYPVLDFTEETEGIDIDAKTINDMLLNVLVSIPETETNASYLLSSVNFTRKSSYLELTTTNSGMVSFARMRLEREVETPASILLPRRGVTELIKLINLKEENASIRLSPNSISYKDNDTIAKFRLIEGNFPNLDKVWKYSFTSQFVFGVKELLSTIRIVSSLAESGKPIILALKDELNVSTVNPEAGDTDASLSCVSSSHEGDTITFKINPNFLYDCIKNLEGNVVFNLINHKNPLYLVPEGRKDINWFIMPMVS